MSTLLFFITIILIVVLLIGIINRAYRRKNIKKKTFWLAVVLTGYAIAWTVFFFLSREKALPFGTDVCFDDWCATVEGMDTASTLGTGSNEIRASGKYIILRVRMSNHARGIAQKPSEPRIHIIDAEGHYWAFSKEGQQALARTAGAQPELGARLELHETLETRIVFDIPPNATGLKAMIEEGPFITKLLLPEDQEVFKL